MALAFVLILSLLLAIATLGWAIAHVRFFVGGLTLMLSQAILMFVASRFLVGTLALGFALCVWLFLGTVLTVVGAVTAVARR